MRAKLSHITHVVRNLDEALSMYFRLLGIAPNYVKRFETEKNQSAFLPVGEDFIRLLQPIQPETPVANFLQTYGEGIYHVCLTVNDLDSEVIFLREKGIDILPSEPESAIKGIYLNPKYTKGVRIEFISPDIALTQAADRVTNNKGIKGVGHLGIIVKDVNQAVTLYCDIFHIQRVPCISQWSAEGMRQAIVQIDDFSFEVIEPTDPQSGLSRFLEQHGEGIHHINLEVEDLPYLIKSLKTEGVAVIERDNKAAFIHPKSFKGVLVQLYEPGSQF